jgi:hypothetical protein
MKVLSYNGQDFAEYVATNYKNSWNYKQKKFYYNSWWMPLPNTGIIKGEQDGKTIEFDMDSCLGRMLGDGTIVTLNDVPKSERWGEIGRTIKYFLKDSILYIYLDKMTHDSTFYDKIKAVGRDKAINKVVIDVRGNGGGSDLVWHKTLQAIIKDTLPYMAQIAFNDNKTMRKKLIGYKKITRFEKIGWLDNRKYGIISDTTMKIAPDTNSLNYSGTIYILTDRSTYSAASTLVNYAEHLDNLVSVGYSTGQMLGFGIMAPLFQLKYSKFTFRLACTMDITNCTKPIDVYHDFPEIEVYPTFEEEILYPHSIYDTKSEEYLYNYDSMFKKVLELK